MRALLVANESDADAGFVGERLSLAGYDFELRAREAWRDWPVLGSPDLVLALGSDWSVYWDHVAAPVEAEASLMRAAHERDVPMLCICFGAQLLSHALGGVVELAPEPEIGWHSVESAEPALAGTWFQWHVDRFNPPAGAEVLAHSRRAVQAYRHGSALAVQFHPEVDDSIVERWSHLGSAELERHGIDAGELRARTAIETARSRAAAHTLVDWFVSLAASPINGGR